MAKHELDITDPTVGTDRGEQLDMFGNLHTVIIKGKCEVKQGDLFQYGKDTPGSSPLSTYQGAGT